MNLLLLEPDELEGTEAEGTELETTLAGARAAHVRGVLRADVGARLRVGVVDGPVGDAEVLAIDASSVRLRCRLGSTPPVPQVDLVLALPRPKVLKRLYAPLAALGVGRVILTNAEKVERYYFDSHAVRPEVIRPRLLEGLSQARDTRVPKVEVSRSIRRTVEDLLADTSARRLLADPVYRRSVYEVASRTQGRLVLALGPEGGWTPYERDLFERHGFVGVGLGPRTLRSDTATVALLTLAHAGLGAASGTFRR
ncbi:MAG: 16S rRNA (uracil(1498)-N(3))-methyltransferase [Sandaracinaceae bacterium]